ncbi:MAG: cellulase family glycosylhydrolase, partial [Candidatus Omnitrophica bacterium]|nr:cellulase family glycosylhydrolase [Candidatus Omnitrophota bacterium]
SGAVMKLTGDTLALLLLGSGNFLEIVAQVFLHPFLHSDVSGNVLENSSFEVGLSGWGKRYGTPNFLDNENLSLEAAHGKYSLRLPVRVKSGLESKLYRLAPDQTYTLSFSAKADQPLSLTAAVYGLSDDLKNYSQAGLSQSFRLSSQWQRFAVTGKLIGRPGYLYTVVFDTSSQAPGTIWLDAVCLKVSEEASYQPKEAVTIGCLGTVAGNIYYENEPANVRILIYKPTGLGKIRLAYQVTDYWGKLTDQGQKEVNLTSSHQEIFLPIKTEKRGIFRLLVVSEESQSELIYSVLPGNQHLHKPYPEGTLGVDTGFDLKTLQVLKRANFNWLITKSLGRWYNLEPEKGRYVFDEESLKNAQKAAMSVLIQFLNPDWGAQKWLQPFWKPAGGAAWKQENKSAFMSAWEEFLFQTVKRYRSYVNYWEIWNEPNCTFTGEEYGELLKRAATAIRKADPKAKIVGFSGGGYDQKFYDEALRVAGADSFDIASVHFYGGDVAAHRGFAGFLRKVGKPGWNTETGSTCPTFFTTLPVFEAWREKNYWQNLQQAIRDNCVSDVKNYLSSLANARLEKYFYYFARFVNCGPSQPTRWAGGGKELVEYDGSLRANAVCLSIASHFLDGATYFGPAGLEERFESHLFEKGEETVGFIWGKTGEDLTLLAPAEGAWKFYDILGNVSRTPEIWLGSSLVYFTLQRKAEQAREIVKGVRWKR